MVTKTVQRAFFGLTSAFKQETKTNPRVTRTLISAQRHADDAWKRTVHGLHDHSHHKGYGK
jgi:hypothetical protein